MSQYRRGGEVLYEALVEAGIDLLVGLPGTQTLPLDRTVAQNEEMDYAMARHETAIPHIAWGYYEASGGIAATLTIPGPGDTNSMHGLKNALEDCVPIVHISAETDPDDRGKGSIHEINPDTYDNVVKANLNVRNEHEFLSTIKRGIHIATTAPYGPVRLGIPSALLDDRIRPTDVDISPDHMEYDNEEEIREAARPLAAADRPVVYVGGGARRSPGASSSIRKLVDELNTPVVASYKGKGVFREDDPHFIGVTGTHLPAGARQVLERADPVLALGTDFDGVTTGHWENPMGDSLIHVNLDPSEFDRSYEADVPIVGDVATVVDSLIEELTEMSTSDSSWAGDVIGSTVRSEYVDHLQSSGYLTDTEPARTPGVLHSLREVIPEETIVTTGIGGHRLWAKQVFQSYDATSYISAGSWAGMGVGLPAAIGAQLACPDRKVVSLIGDGSLLMCYQELHLAAERDLDIVVVVFNNSDYGIISKSPKIDRYTEGHQFKWSSPDFVRIAEGFGGRGITAHTKGEAADAVSEALDDGSGPVVVDVQIETEEASVVDAADYESTALADAGYD